MNLWTIFVFYVFSIRFNKHKYRIETWTTNQLKAYSNLANGVDDGVWCPILLLKKKKKWVHLL